MARIWFPVRVSTSSELARAIGMPAVTLFTWMRRGWVTARRQEQPPYHWILWADPAEVERLRERHQRPPGYYTCRRWSTSP